jgi:arylsulfatase A-like enzyme
VTIAEHLKGEGYATCHIGKWHLGSEAYWPETQGFDHNIGGYHRGQPPSYFAPYKIPTLEEGPDGEYLTDREAAEAVKFITSNRDHPFFLYLPHYTVHTPIQSKKEMQPRYRNKVKPGMKQTRADYAAMIESLDQSVGTITATLDRLGIADRTAIIFTSDNGGLVLGKVPVTDNSPLRAGKGSAYEGGVRVPLIVKWPGVTGAGSRSDEPVISVDYFPTISEMVGAESELPPDIDGRSIVPILRGSDTLGREAIYWHYPHYHPGGATPYSAVRAGDFRLVQFYEDGHSELYNLREDLGETKDLTETLPEKSRQLVARLDAWRRSVDAQSPLPNPSWNGK